MPLLRLKGLSGVGGGGRARRHDAGNQRRDEESKRSRSERQWVPRGCLKQERGDVAATQQRQNQAKRHPSTGISKGLPEDQAHQIS